LVALEALVRWQHPDGGLLTPDVFVPLAEDAGLIVPLGRWVIEEACRQLAEWRDAGSHLGQVRVSINLSARQFADAGLLDTVRYVLRTFNLPGSAVGFEITESVLMEEAEVAAETLRRLKALGVHLAIDDFGTGYSSLSYLQLFPVDTVKIDRSFITHMVDDRANHVIVAAVIGLARALGMDVVAEGVECPAQVEQLRSLGCEIVQGYLFGRPQPPEAMALATVPAPALAATRRG
ncbi:MAG TPA: EAL domain-containing protein, partial [Acidimicrobiales bacterium]|nr:EAL domain-containing protein [Acidimicrobiales bacterium]